VTNVTSPLVIAVDAMGSDGAPGPDVAGAVAAVREAPLEVELCGDGPRLEAELARLGARHERAVRVVHAPEVVTMDDHPAQAFRAKRASSLRVAIDRVKAGAAGGDGLGGQQRRRAGPRAVRAGAEPRRRAAGAGDGVPDHRRAADLVRRRCQRRAAPQHAGAVRRCSAPPTIARSTAAPGRGSACSPTAPSRARAPS
jgi:hypothetical protein